MIGYFGLLRRWRARLYPAASTPDAVTTVPQAGSLLNLTAFSLVGAFKFPSGSTFRSIYQEEGDLFNKRAFVRVDTGGDMQWHYRTPTASINPPDVPGGTVDDDVWHTFGLVRRSTGSNLFTFYRDAISRQTDATDPGALSSETTIQAYGNNPIGGNGFDDASDGLIAHGYIVDTDLSASQIETLINTGVTPSGTILYVWETGVDSSTVLTEIAA